MTNGHVCSGDRGGCARAIDHPALGATQLRRLVPPPTPPPSLAPGLGVSPPRLQDSGGRRGCPPVLPLQISPLGGGACSGAVSAAADPTGIQRTPGTHPASLCTSRSHPQTPARTHTHPKAHSFAHVSQPVTGYRLPEQPAPPLCQPRHLSPTNLSLSGGASGAGQEQEAPPQGWRGGSQLLEPPQLTHPTGPLGT